MPVSRAPDPSAAEAACLPAALDASTRLLAGLSALALGAVLVWGAGFASAATLHDTAHDVRHGFGFPCH